MTFRVLLDVEEAISREVRRLTFSEDKSPTYTSLQEAFDPLTGELVQVPIEPDFYDSSADTKHIQYPHVFIKLLRMREDRTTGRIIPQYGQSIVCQNTTTPKAYEILVYQNDATILTTGNTITTNTYKLRKAVPGNLLRIVSGNNQGTYTIDSIDFSSSPFVITVSDVVVNNTPELVFDSVSRTVTYKSPVDLRTVKVGDTFTDADSNTFLVDDVFPDDGYFTIDGVSSPSEDEGSTITRSGDMFDTVDPSLVTYLIMDHTKPVFKNGVEVYQGTTSINPAIPLDLFYMVRIDSKERLSHIEVANRMWEEFNPPRTALPTIVRTKDSAETKLAADITGLGSATIDVESNEGFRVNDPVFIFNDLVPTKDIYGNGFQEVFSAKVLRKIGTDQLELDTIVPSTFTIDQNTKIVSNAQYWKYMFHLEDHVTRDVEGAQYWSHEFTFWVQVWIDRQGMAEVRNSPVYHIQLVGEEPSPDITILDC